MTMLHHEQDKVKIVISIPRIHRILLRAIAIDRLLANSDKHASVESVAAEIIKNYLSDQEKKENLHEQEKETYKSRVIAR
jgi:hypothetical protein